MPLVWLGMTNAARHPVTLGAIVTQRSTCRNPSCPHPSFTPQRAGAQYCSQRCRIAAWRLHQRPPPDVEWQGKVPIFRKVKKADLADRLLEIAEQGDDGEPKTGRRYYYLALSHGDITPDMGDSKAAKKSRDKAYDSVLDILGTLRKAGRLGWDMVLDLTRELDEWLTYASPREARAHMRRIYDEDRWLGQPYYPIFIVEKDTMEPVCKPMARRWQMPFASSRGYSSLTLQHDVAELLKRRYAQIAEMLKRRHDQTGQTAIIYIVTDLDASGLDLQRAWQQAMQDFGISWHCRFVRIALTPEQVADPDLDLDRLAIAVKPSDSRAKKYIKQYGNRCWEVDILPAEIIEQTLDADVRGWLDDTLWEQRAAEIERARTLL
jgi:hypothetical protein